MNLLITDDTQNAHSLLDRWNQNETISGIDVKSIQDIAREIVIHDLSSQGKIIAIREPKRLACAYMIQTIMERLNEEGKLSYFTGRDQKPIDDFSTCQEIYNKMNEIRLGNTTKDYETTDDPKIRTLKAILEEFVKKLQDENAYDATRFILEANDAKKIDAWKQDNPDVTVYEQVFSEKNLPDQTKLFLKLFLEKLNAEDFEVYCQKTTKESVSDLEKGEHKCSFAKAYGISSEVADIVSEIHDHQIPYGDVSVYYPNQDYETYLDAEFASRNVPLTFSLGRNPKGSEYFRIARGILEWAAGGFYYDQLRPVFSSSLLQHDKHSNPGFWYEKEIEAGVGFGLDRYYAYAKTIQKQFDKHHLKGKTEEDLKGKEERKDDLNLFRIKNLADYLRGLANIFNVHPVSEEDLGKADYSDIQTPDSAEIYRNLISWLDEFTRKSSPDKERSNYLSLLKDQSSEMDLVHITDLKESCAFLLDELDHLRISDPDRPNAVRAIRVNQYRVENRKHVWFIGLSVNEIESAKTDSPVLTDDELTGYLENPVALASDYARNMRGSLENTLATVNGKARLTYTYYETNTLLNWNPSSYYVEMKGDQKEDSIPDKEEKTELEKTILFTRKADPAQVKEDPLKRTDLLKKYVLGDPNEDGEKPSVQKPFSPTSAETLLTCEQKYYLQYILNIKEPEESQILYDQWLTGKDLGNLFHYVLKDYADACLIGKETGEEPDQDQLNQIFENQITKMRESHVCMNEATFQKECENYKTILKTYLTRLYEDLHENGWKVAGAEFPLEPGIIRDGDQYSLVQFHGTLDRYDYKENEDGSRTYRIVDYKTGRRDNLQKQIDHKQKIQHQVYMELLKRKLKIRDQDTICFEYDLIVDDPGNYNPIIEYQDPDSKDEVAEKIAALIDCFQSRLTLNVDDCKYCPYIKLCGRMEVDPDEQ